MPAASCTMKNGKSLEMPYVKIHKRKPSCVEIN